MIYREGSNFVGSICIDGIKHYLYNKETEQFLVNSIIGTIIRVDSMSTGVGVPQIVEKSVELLEERLRIGATRKMNEVGTDQLISNLQH